MNLPDLPPTWFWDDGDAHCPSESISVGTPETKAEYAWARWLPPGITQAMWERMEACKAACEMVGPFLRDTIPWMDVLDNEADDPVLGMQAHLAAKSGRQILAALGEPAP